MSRIFNKELSAILHFIILMIVINQGLFFIGALCLASAWSEAWKYGVESEKQRQKQSKDAEMLIKKIIEEYKKEEE